MTKRTGYTVIQATIFFTLNLIFTGHLAISHHNLDARDCAEYFRTSVELYEESSDGNATLKDRIFYPALVSQFYRVLDTQPSYMRPPQIGQFISALSKSMISVVLVLITSLFFNQFTVFVVSLFYLLDGNFLKYGIIFSPDTTFCFFYWAAITCFLYALHFRKSWLMSFCGILAGLASVTRFEGVFLVPIVLFCIFYHQISSSNVLNSSSIKKRCWHLLKETLLFGGPLLVIIGFVTAKGYFGGKTNLALMPKWELSYLLHDFTLDEYLRVVGGWYPALSLRLKNILGFYDAVFADNLFFPKNGMLPLLTVILIVLFFFKIFKRQFNLITRNPCEPNLFRLLFIVGLAVVFQSIIQIGYLGWRGGGNTIRHALIVCPLLIVAFGVVSSDSLASLATITSAPKKKKITSFLIVAVVLVSFLQYLSLNIEQIKEQIAFAYKKEHLENDSLAATWCFRNLPIDAKIFSRKSSRTWIHSKRNSFCLPLASVESFLKLANDLDAKYIILTDLEHKHRPNIEFAALNIKPYFQVLRQEKKFSIVKINLDLFKKNGFKISDELRDKLRKIEKRMVKKYKIRKKMFFKYRYIIRLTL